MQLVKLMGGLGNQMFQYAFAKALGDKKYSLLRRLQKTFFKKS